MCVYLSVWVRSSHYHTLFLSHTITLSFPDSHTGKVGDFPRIPPKTTHIFLFRSMKGKHGNEKRETGCARLQLVRLVTACPPGYDINVYGVLGGGEQGTATSMECDECESLSLSTQPARWKSISLILLKTAIFSGPGRSAPQKSDRRDRRKTRTGGYMRLNNR